MLGANAENTQAATEALAAWPGGLQIGGGITATNAAEWIARGADKVILTSWLFPDGRFSTGRAEEVIDAVGGVRRLVIDVSCRRGMDGNWRVATNRWQTVTDVVLGAETLADFSRFGAEFLVHAADVEGVYCANNDDMDNMVLTTQTTAMTTTTMMMMMMLMTVLIGHILPGLCRGIDGDLVERLGEWSTLPCTYAGGGMSIADLGLVERLSGGRVDLTFGSALDIFGGTGVRLSDCIAWNSEHRPS
jgi:phosphoribosylformimino-5-aminoimidazole carboxamide ribotide isomerase